MYTTKQILASIALVGAASATTHKIEVGNGGLVFSPNSTTAAVGDTLQFVFYPRNHSVAQSSFNSPCVSSTGIFSGYFAPASGPANTTFTVTVNDTNPIWLYCSYGQHCQDGMVACVNCPTSGDTLAAYAAAAKNASMATAPAMVEGGVLGSLSSANSTASSSTSASSTRTSSSSTATGMGSSTSSQASSGTASASASATSAKSGANGMAVASWNILSAAAAGLCGVGLYFL